LALRVELTFLALRVAQLRHIDAVLAAGRCVLADWAMLKQPIFAATTLDPADTARLAATVELWAPALPTPDLLIGLSASTAVLRGRVRRRGRNLEAGGTAAQLAALSSAFEAAYLQWSGPLIRVDTDTGAPMRHPAPNPTIDVTATAAPLCRRLLITGPGTVELIAEHLPPLGAHDVYARTVVSGISHGTEIAWLTGAAAALHRRWDTSRRFYRDGPGRDFPVAPGYESIARIALVGPAVTTVKVGDLVAVDAPHADGHLLTETTAAAGLLPAAMDPQRAVFFTLARVALGGVHDAALSVGDAVVVVGLGTVGLLATQMARHAGAMVIGVDRYPLRTAAASCGQRKVPLVWENLGVEARSNPNREALSACTTLPDGRSG
jgi:hypothetical protein